MFNLYQYSQYKHTQREKSKEQRKMTSFSSKHQSFKKVAEINRRVRLDDFIDSEISKVVPEVIPDDYMERTRSQHHHSLQQKGHLRTNSRNKINNPNEYPKSLTKYTYNKTNNKSIQSLRLTKQDMKHLPLQSGKIEQVKPIVSYSALRFNQKADYLMRQFQKNKQQFDRVCYVNRDRYRLCQPKQFKSIKQQTEKQSKQLSKTKSRKAQNPQQPSLPVCFSHILEPKSQSKTYFKLAKTEQLFTKDNMKKMQLDSLLSRSHYNRIKNDEYSTKVTGWPLFSSFAASNSVILP